MRKTLTALITASILFSSLNALAGADVMATTERGKKVNLHSDGTYSYAKKAKATIYKKVHFVDLLVDKADLIGTRIRLKVGAVPEWYGISKYISIHDPRGPGGKSARAEIDLLSKDELKNAHRCGGYCRMEVSGIVKKVKVTYSSSPVAKFYAESIKLLD